MINWIYTWYNARVDGDADALATQMSNIVLNGIVHGGKPRVRRQPQVRVNIKRSNLWRR
jgi:hypothetical protein